MCFRCYSKDTCSAECCLNMPVDDELLQKEYIISAFSNSNNIVTFIFSISTLYYLISYISASNVIQ